jgi:hypothetical protein
VVDSLSAWSSCERLVELSVGQDPRAETEDVVAQVPDHLIDILDGRNEAASDLGVAR